MIAEHHEPKLLDPNAEPIWDLKRDMIDKEKALRGSARLRDALRSSLGLGPWLNHAQPDKCAAQNKRLIARKKATRSRLWKMRMRDRARVIKVQKAACEHFGISLPELTGSRGNLDLARRRQVAMLVSRITTRASYPDIGGCFNRDHSTVMHACEVISEYDLDVIAICEKLAG